MTLSIQRSDRRDRRLCRFGVMLVVCSLVINMVAVPKAKAVVIDATAAFGAAAATAAINGTTATTLFTGMGTSAATGSVIGLMDTYAAATGVAASGTALASTIATGILVAGGTLLVGAAAAALIGGFIDWLREEEGLEPGGKPIYIGGLETGFFNYSGLVLPAIPSGIDLSVYKYCSIRFVSDQDYYALNVSNTAPFLDGDTVKVPKGATYYSAKCVPSDSVWSDLKSNHLSTDLIIANSKRYIIWANYDIEDGRGNSVTASSPSPVYEPGSAVEIQPKPEFQEIPNNIPEGQILSIDTGLSTLPQDDPQAITDAIMQSAIDGALAPTVSVQADPSVQPDPDPEPDPELPPDAPELPSNLGDLGKALTTRFPFSIPWDIAKAVKLLAAPPKPPYWEIDFMEPIRYRFSDLGDTTITIDLGKPEYEIIGITTRLTSTIGFCLALAAATKRFIWTA